ncbi:MAG: cytochrome ubiquinol oxidase subunit I [Alphaproteobacteria bacterium]|nr:cytochrome ubiquinol oxidase subunit I [Alphaproteobacteria bacterium]
MDIDPILLSRLQFAFTVAFHILFPTLTIGLACFLAVVEGLWLKTRDGRWRDLYQFWVKVFALSFGMGVVSGIPMSFQFGTNFSPFALATGNVLGPLLGYEVLTAFFLEASFLGIMLFGWKRVGPGLHYFATLMVAFGTTLSAFWILSANSWMQTPQGAQIGPDGVFHVVSWWKVIFNPSFPYRLAHMLVASLLTMSFVVAGVSSWQVLKQRHADTARKALGLALGAAAILAPLQLLVGDMHGLNTLEHQPTKVAAMEGNWQTGPRKPLLLFAWPDPKTESNTIEFGIPDGASLILRHDPDGVIPGLTAVPPDERPPVAIVFYAFRIMVGLGVLMIAAAWTGVALRKRLPRTRPYLWLLVGMGPAGFVATLAGWTVTEVGRQPWTVYGLVRTAHSVSPQLDAPTVVTSLMLFAIVYNMVLAAFLYFAARTVSRGPAPQETAPRPALMSTQAAE